MIIISEPTLNLFRQAAPCENCLQWCQRRQPHHLWSRGCGGGQRLDIPIGLVGICAGCHQKCPGILTRTHCLQIVSRREGVEVEDIISVVYFIRRLPKNVRRWQVNRATPELGIDAQALAWRMLEGNLLEEAS